MKLNPRQTEIVFRPGFLLQTIAIHGLSIVALSLFWSGTALIVAASLGMLTGHMIGIFFHMRLTHASFECPRWLERTGVLIGALSWRGPFAYPIRWVAIHRVHHIHSDTEFDVHSPTQGIWRAFIGWFWRMPRGFSERSIYQGYAPDAVARDPFYQWIENNIHTLQLAWGTACFVAGGFYGAGGPERFDLWTATQWLLYGVFVKTLVILWAGNLLDIVNHSPWGYRNYETGDLSRNSRMLGLIFWGGVLSWHNNHHAHPGAFKVQNRWWELDGHYLLLRLLQPLGLAWNIRVQNDYRRAKPQRAAKEPFDRPLPGKDHRFG